MMVMMTIYAATMRTIGQVSDDDHHLAVAAVAVDDDGEA